MLTVWLIVAGCDGDAAVATPAGAVDRASDGDTGELPGRDMSTGGATGARADGANGSDGPGPGGSIDGPPSGSPEGEPSATAGGRQMGADDGPPQAAADEDASDPMLDAGSQPSDPVESTEPASADGGATVMCPESALESALEPGLRMASLMHDGLEREFVIYVPQGYDNARPVPLVLNFHGATSNAEQQRTLFSKMDETADEKGFIVVYPQGIGRSWNAGACCGDAASEDVDDVGFALAIVEFMAERACIDRARVYATGFSNGGRMSYRLACQAADVFAAIAPVAGTKSFPDLRNSPGCEPSRPLSLIDFMGTDDSRISAQPGQVAEWVSLNGCTDAEPAEVYRSGDHFCEAYTECEAGTSVTYCVVDGGGHCWPGSTPCPLGSTSSASDLSANELMWELFERSSL
ncbi:MAG: prolyl oligopeptidase family serine peptidase [Myxococcales bacterium]|nr:prolyl oligopeptidase family serine peptidase [Myxococcales bacterium]